MHGVDASAVGEQPRMVARTSAVASAGLGITANPDAGPHQGAREIGVAQACQQAPI